MALSLILLGIFVIVFLICPRHLRMSFFLSAFISAPYGFASVFFVPEYWKPIRVFELFAGPEDILFSFANGGTVWVIAIWLLRDRVRLEINPKRIIAHTLGYVSFGYSCFIIFRFLDIGAMAAAIASICVLGVVVLAVRRDLWPMALAGSVSFLLLYFATIKLCFGLFPEFLLQWNHLNLWGPTVFGVPLDELVWAAGFGGVWPMMMAWTFDVRFASERDAKNQEGTKCSQKSAVGT